MEFSAQQIAHIIQGEIEGDPSVTVSTFAKIEEATAGSLTFLGNEKYTPYIYTTQASIVLTDRVFQPSKPINSTLIRVDNPYQGLSTLMSLVQQTLYRPTGLHATALIDTTATVGNNLYIGAYTCIEADATIGDNCQIYPQVYIGKGVTVGNNCIIYPGVKIYHACVIGNNCIIHSGTIIGADGFGFAPEGDLWKKIPQLGNVVIEDNVEIGANSTIDRSSMGSTLIQKGTKIDNLVHIAHNVTIGENTLLCALVGIAGSAKVGHNVILGGQAGVSGHLTIGDRAQIGPQAGVIGNIKPGIQGLGMPCIPAKDYMKAFAIFKTLPDINQTIKSLQKEIDALKNNSLNNE